jgi:hypothetical protein
MTAIQEEDFETRQHPALATLRWALSAGLVKQAKVCQRFREPRGGWQENFLQSD